MKSLFVRMLFIALLGLACVERAPAAAADEKIQVLERDGAIMLTVPVSRLAMLIPKQEAVTLVSNAASGGSNSPRYFYFEDRKAGIIASGWFESAGGYSNAKNLWAEETATWKKKGLPEPSNVQFQPIGKWDAITYELPVPSGANTHIRAQWVEAGTWIDLHLSMTSVRPLADCQAALMALLNSILVREKN